MLSHEGIALRRIQFLASGCGCGGRFLIERIDRKTFVVPLHAIGADNGIDEVLATARTAAGKILEDSFGTATAHEA